MTNLMKTSSTIRHAKTLVTVGILGSMLVMQPLSAATRTAGVRPLITGEDDPKKAKTKAEKKSFASLNNQSVKIYPDPLNRDMHVVAKDNVKNIDFFVFDLQGTLIENYKMKAHDHFKISGLARGIYVYRVFSGDEETASGKFEIR
jgi:hypothetical protein